MNKLLIILLKLYKSASNIIWRYQPAGIIYSSCKFYPTCSEYAQEAIKKHGSLAGGLMSAGRICRCNPFNKGGYDPVK